MFHFPTSGLTRFVKSAMQKTKRLWKKPIKFYMKLKRLWTLIYMNVCKGWSWPNEQNSETQFSKVMVLLKRFHVKKIWGDKMLKFPHSTLCCVCTYDFVSVLLDFFDSFHEIFVKVKSIFLPSKWLTSSRQQFEEHFILRIFRWDSLEFVSGRPNIDTQSHSNSFEPPLITCFAKETIIK